MRHRRRSCRTGCRCPCRRRSGPAFPGNSRVALGTFPQIICTPEIAANTREDRRQHDSPTCRSRSAGRSANPAGFPERARARRGHSTAPCRLCACMLESDVKTIVAMAVATAMCTMCSRGKCSCVNRIVRIGTMIIVPPMPSSPARKPMTHPSATKAAISEDVHRRLGFLCRELARPASSRPAPPA